MKNKKLQIILLVILLVAVLVGGIYFLTQSSKKVRRCPSMATADSGSTRVNSAS